MTYDEATREALRLAPLLAEAFRGTSIPGAEVLTSVAIGPDLDEDLVPTGEWSLVARVGYRTSDGLGNHVLVTDVPPPDAVRDQAIALLGIDLRRSRLEVGS